MAQPIRPQSRTSQFACPVCEQPSVSVSFNAGWKVEGLMGTRVGTYPEVAPVEPGRDGGFAAPVEPFAPLNEYVVEPCGDHITADQTSAIRDQLRRT